MAETLERLECELREVTRYQNLFPDEGGKTKKGSYHGTYFWSIPKFGQQKWVIAVHIVGPDIDTLLEEGHTEEEIATACVEHLNILPKRKKYAKKAPKRPYGNLELYRHHLKEDDEGNKFFSALIITDERKNKAFWGEGQKENRVRKWGNKNKAFWGEGQKVNRL